MANTVDTLGEIKRDQTKNSNLLFLNVLCCHRVCICYRISRRISRVSGHQNRGQKIDLDLYEGHIISVVRLLIKNLACLAICSF